MNRAVHLDVRVHDHREGKRAEAARHLCLQFLVHPLQSQRDPCLDRRNLLLDKLSFEVRILGPRRGFRLSPFLFLPHIVGNQYLDDCLAAVS